MPDDSSGSDFLDILKQVDRRILAIGVGGSLLLGVLIIVGVLLLRNGGEAGNEPAEVTLREPQVVDDTVTMLVPDGQQAEVQALTLDEAVEAGDQWLVALEALPTYLVPISSFYESSIAQTAYQFKVPADDSVQADLYWWNVEAGAWVFAPAVEGDAPNTIVTAGLDGPVALFQPTPVAALLGTTLTVNSPPLPVDQASLMNVFFAPGLVLQPGGDLDTQSFDATRFENLSTLVFPVVALSPDLTEADVDSAVESLVDFAVESGYTGLMLDVSNEPLQDADLVLDIIQAATAAFTEADKVLAVKLGIPDYVAGQWGAPAYDWGAIGLAADIIVADAPGTPGDYTADGLNAAFMDWALRRVSRVKFYVSTTALSVDDWEGQINPVSYEYALRPLGNVQLLPGQFAPNEAIEPGQPLVFELSSEVTNLEQDPASGAYRYEAFAGDGLHTVWIVTGNTLRQRLDWLASYNVAGIMVDDLFHSSNRNSMVRAVEEFKRAQPSTLSEELKVQWQIETAGGTVLLERESGLNAQLEWTPADEGDYIVSADLAGEGGMGLGAEAILVGGETVGVASAVEAVVSGDPELEITSERANAAAIIPGESINLADVPPPVVQPSVYGNFELGGQVNHVIENPGYMKEAGMEWVKFQLAWGEDQSPDVAYGLIQQGRQQGFKVLLSIVSQSKYPASVNYEDYLEFVEGVAYYGPDAIEIWNEQNIEFEWPAGQIDGGVYVRDMLAPAYNAIKTINPNIMVISGAPAPTGAFFEDGGCSLQGTGCDDWVYIEQMARAGGANYMDCVGVHFNSGATSPTASSGHPADPGYQHYSWYYSSMVQLYSGTFGRPVCFTELGYLSGEGYGAVPARFSWASDISVSEQAQWLAEAARLSRENGQVRMMIVWNVDFWFWGDDPMAGYAIVRPDGRCPACSSLGNVMR